MIKIFPFCWSFWPLMRWSKPDGFPRYKKKCLCCVSTPRFFYCFSGMLLLLSCVSVLNRYRSVPLKCCYSMRRPLIRHLKRREIAESSLTTHSSNNHARSGFPLGFRRQVCLEIMAVWCWFRWDHHRRQCDDSDVRASALQPSKRRNAGLTPRIARRESVQWPAPNG